MPGTIATLPTKCAHPLGLRYIPRPTLDMQVRLRHKHVLPRYDKHIVELVRLAKLWLEHTRRKQAENVLSQLEWAAKAADESKFLEALKEIDWQDRSAKDFSRAARLALEAGAHLAAREISSEGARLHPGDPEIQKYARILAPPSIISTNVPADPNRGSNLRWLKAHREEYAGNWVALRGGQLIDVAESQTRLIAKVGNTKGTKILLTRVF